MADTRTDVAVQWDVFISHASEDKEAVARPLAELLARARLRVWLDENELRLGDSLRAKIDQGLAQSRCGVVILSRAFFQKEWPQRELNGLFAAESAHRRHILPVWHQVDHQFVASYSPMLADRLATSTERGLQGVAAAIVKAVAGAEVEERGESGPADPRADASGGDGGASSGGPLAGLRAGIYARLYAELGEGALGRGATAEGRASLVEEAVEARADHHHPPTRRRRSGRSSWTTWSASAC